VAATSAAYVVAQARSTWSAAASTCAAVSSGLGSR
jgi:hypothetical protein